MTFVFCVAIPLGNAFHTIFRNADFVAGTAFGHDFASHALEKQYSGCLWDLLRKIVAMLFRMLDL